MLNTLNVKIANYPKPTRPEPGVAACPLPKPRPMPVRPRPPVAVCLPPRPPVAVCPPSVCPPPRPMPVRPQPGVPHCPQPMPRDRYDGGLGSKIKNAVADSYLVSGSGPINEAPKYECVRPGGPFKLDEGFNLRKLAGG